MYDTDVRLLHWYRNPLLPHGRTNERGFSKEIDDADLSTVHFTCYFNFKFTDDAIWFAETFSLRPGQGKSICQRYWCT